MIFTLFWQKETGVMQVSLGDFVEVIPSEEEQEDGNGLKHFYVVRVTELFQDTEVHHSPLFKPCIFIIMYTCIPLCNCFKVVPRIVDPHQHQ